MTLAHGDLRGVPGALPPGALPPGGFDLVTGTPPYIPPGAGGVSADRPQKAPCNVEQRGGVEAYVDAAARVLAPHGTFAVCMVRAGGRGGAACSAACSALACGAAAHPAPPHTHTPSPQGVQGQRVRDRVPAAAVANGLVVARCLEVIPREGKPPLMHVYALQREGSGAAPAAERERFVVRAADGSLSPQMHAARAVIGMPPARGAPAL